MIQPSSSSASTVHELLGVVIHHGVLYSQLFDSLDRLGINFH